MAAAHLAIRRGAEYNGLIPDPGGAAWSKALSPLSCTVICPTCAKLDAGRSGRLGRGDAHDEHFLATIAKLDNPFPDIDYRLFHTREKPAP